MKKVCSKCGKTKPISAFGVRPEAPDGHKGRCKSCMAEYNRTWHAKNPEKVRAKYKRWRASHMEYDQQRHKDYYARNLERLRRRGTEYFKEWCKRFPEKKRAQGWRYRARKAAVHQEFGAVEAKFVREFQGNHCVVCGREKSLSGRALCLDHWRALSKGNPLSLSNAVLLCNSCNSRKHSKEPEEVYSAEFVVTVEALLKDQAEAWESMGRLG